ncbi:MAG: hypothetical protein JHC95_06050 [Solirubrobacteraceae bacterium]|nr:hypothetical protein [Solirubrobacteraceae bacterium]
MSPARWITALTILGLALPAGADAAAPASGVVERVETPWVSAAATDVPRWTGVTQSFVRLRAPLSARYPAHPAACDWITYLRYRAADGPADPRQADAVYVGMPGIFGGASDFDIIGRNIVSEARSQGRHVEVWGIDRRSNCLEDRTGIDAAKTAKDARVALDYYYRGKEIEGRRFEDFRGTPPSTFRIDLHGRAQFQRQLGVEQTLQDYYAVIAEAFPDPAERRQKVVCGGHSLGGILTGLFLAWDFDGNRRTTDDAGYSQCAGFIALDTFVVSRADRKIVPALGALTGLSGPLEVPGDPFISLPVINPELMALITGAAGNAYFDGARETTLQREVPRTPRVREALRILFSRDLAHYQRGGRPDLTDLRLTSEAVFGLMLDDNVFNVTGIAQISMGFPAGGRLVEKNFPLPNALALLPGLRPLTGNLLGGGRLIVPSEPAGPGNTGPLYRWRTLGDVPTNRYTNPGRETADLRQVARAFFEPPADFVEYYFPTKLVTDVGAALVGIRAGTLGRHLLHDDAAFRLPGLNLLAGEGPARVAGSIRHPGRSVVLPGYKHLDPLTAAPEQASGDAERGMVEATDFLVSLAG